MFLSEWREFPSASCMCSVYYRGADKSLARPGRKQANISVRMAWISFVAPVLRGKKKLDDSSRLDVVEIARVPDMLPSLIPFLVGPNSAVLAIIKFAPPIRRWIFIELNNYRGADNSLARPERTQANVSVRMAWISFGALLCKEKKNLDESSRLDVVEIALSLSCFRAWFHSWSGRIQPCWPLLNSRHPSGVEFSYNWIIYRGTDKSLARPERKQANVSVRMAWISFGALLCKKKKTLMTARVSMLLKSRASLSCFRACFLPGRAKDLSTPR